MVQVNELIGNRKLMSLLNYFLNHPSEELQQVDLIKKTKISKTTAVKWMDILVKNNFLLLKKIGVSNLYRLNSENQILKQMKITNTLIQLQEINKLKEKEIKDKDIEIYLYGSSARGEDNENSDIDLLILGSIKRNEIVDFLDNLSKKISRQINFNIFSNMEWSQMHKKDKSYYERVEKDKIRIL